MSLGTFLAQSSLDSFNISGIYVYKCLITAGENNYDGCVSEIVNASLSVLSSCLSSLQVYEVEQMLINSKKKKQT